VIDATNSNLAIILQTYLQAITIEYSGQLVSDFLMHKGLSYSAPIAVEPRIQFNPELKSANFMVPGVIGVLTLIVLLNLTSLSVVRERELGTAEQLSVTPIRPVELIIGKTLPAVFAGYLVTSLVLVVGLIWFQIDFAGSAVLLYIFAGFFMFCAISMGLLISTYSQTGDQAMWANQFIMMPNVLLSGFIFPIKNMPVVIQYISYFLPMRYYLKIIRGIFIQGAGLVELWPQATALILWGIVVVMLASLRLRRHMV
jgi:ABC-2 type transport system permease protein